MSDEIIAPFATNPLRSVHTKSFPLALAELQASLLVTTYQSGKLVILRQQNGVLNTHFRSFPRPMGLASQRGRIAIGCRNDIREYHDVPATCGLLEAVDASTVGGSVRYDACYLPRRSSTTGNVQIHEMAWLGEKLVFVNTAFSCLASTSDRHSFEPIWRPPFIDRLAPGDACHLNGLCIRDGAIRFVTALGTSSEPSGWRQEKRNGGVLIDVAENEVVCQGLSMPHSPRWYADHLWLLESGEGTLGIVDLTKGRYEPVFRLPGFTRGLSFHGSYAFVGLSQVRESATFGGIPLLEYLPEPEQRYCGVWILNISTGEVVGFCRFEEGVQEIFAIEILPGNVFPELINHDPDIIDKSFVLSDAALVDVPERLRS
jgi:uncharacterized protein (TIGR03032 family)